MATNPIEVSYQTGRNLYCVRVSLENGATAKLYNTNTQLYETYAAANWTLYAIALTEVLPGYYRVACPAGSITVPATEIFFERLGVTAATSDAPPIAAGNSQGVNIGTINGVQASIGSNPSAIVDICNLALTHLGQKQITALSDQTEYARKLNQIYNTCRDEVLRSASWKFATVIKELVNLADEEAIGWGYVYTYPTDCVFVRKVFADAGSVFDLPMFNSPPFVLPSTNPQGIEYRVIYQVDLSLPVIVTNVSPAYIEYTGRVIDPAVYDALFIKALSYKLAAEVSVPLSGDTAQYERMMKMYAAVMSEAARQNGVETGVLPRKQSSYLDAR